MTLYGYVPNIWGKLGKSQVTIWLLYGSYVWYGDFHRFSKCSLIFYKVILWFSFFSITFFHINFGLFLIIVSDISILLLCSMVIFYYNSIIRSPSLHQVIEAPDFVTHSVILAGRIQAMVQDAAVFPTLRKRVFGCFENCGDCVFWDMVFDGLLMFVWWCLLFFWWYLMVLDVVLDGFWCVCWFLMWCLMVFAHFRDLVDLFGDAF